MTKNLRTFTVIAQGGGIMTARHAGVIRALDELGVLDRVSDINAISGGAANWVYVASRQIRHITPIWTELMACGKFISFKRWPPLNGIMDIDVLIDEFVKGKKFCLDTEALYRSRVRVNVCATHAYTGRANWFRPYDVPDFYEVLRASCTVPYFSGPPVSINGQPYYDGGISSATGIEHLDVTRKTLVVLTRPRRERGFPMTVRRSSRWLLIRNESPGLQEAIFTSPERRAREMQRLNELEMRLGPEQLCVLRPESALPAFRIDSRRGAVAATIEQGYRETLESVSLRAFLRD